MIEVVRTGWAQPVGVARCPGFDVDRVRQRGEIRYERQEIIDLRLSHAASLFLLQGASLSQLLTDVVLACPTCTQQGCNHFYSVVFSEPPMLWRPPPTIARVVLARLLERPVYMSPEQFLAELFAAETT